MSQRNTAGVSEMSYIIITEAGSIDVRIDRTGATTTYNYVATDLDGGVTCSGMAQFREGAKRCQERACSCRGACGSHVVVAEYFRPGLHCGCIEHTGQICEHCA